MDIDENRAHTTDPTRPASADTGAGSAPARTPRRRFRLRRSPDDVMLAGVCGGVAEELNLDPALLRIAMVVLTILTYGLAAVAYLAAWILAPVEPAS